MYREISEELLDFLQKSPTAFHAVENIKEELNKEGFVELLEGKPWKMTPGGKYYVTRNNSSIIALKVGSNLENYSFNVAASHSDCPTFKLKENAELEVKGKYTQLNTEGYGGMICSTWFDKPLSIAGRLLIKDGNELKTQLINIDRDLVLIPNMAIHMNRAGNDGYAYNNQIDMLPLFGGADCKPGDFMKLVAKEAGVQVEDIYGSDLYLYNRTAPSIWGANDEFISSQHLDDLQCAFTSLKGFLAGGNDQSIDVLACFDNEEVGSGTKQGAASTLLYDVLKRANSALGKTEEDTYVTHVDQVKQDKDITITLKDAIASDQQLRCSVLVTNKDKTKTKLKDVQMEDMKINDQEPEENRGYAVLGKENVKKGTIHFLSVNYQRQDIPVNPKISLKVRVKSKLYHFKFVLKNQRFKKATKTVSIDQEIKLKGQTIQLDDLIVTPIDQIITIKVLKKQQTKIKNEEILLSGTNQRGDKVYFEAFLDKFTGNEYLYGTRENDDQMTYELDEKDLTYTLKTEEGQKLKIKP